MNFNDWIWSKKLHYIYRFLNIVPHVTHNRHFEIARDCTSKSTNFVMLQNDFYQNATWVDLQDFYAAKDLPQVQRKSINSTKMPTKMDKWKVYSRKLRLRPSNTWKMYTINSNILNLKMPFLPIIVLLLNECVDQSSTGLGIHSIGNQFILKFK